MPRDFREAMGEMGRDWVCSDESRMTAEMLGDGMIKCIDHLFDTWKPRNSFEIINTDGYSYKPKHSGVIVDSSKIK